MYSKAPPEGSTTLWAALRAAFPDAMTDTRQFEDAVANVAFMYVAGYETTSNAIMHTLSALALDQDSQAAVVAVRSQTNGAPSSTHSMHSTACAARRMVSLPCPAGPLHASVVGRPW